jgi:hypothetical protein
MATASEESSWHAHVRGLLAVSSWPGMRRRRCRSQLLLVLLLLQGNITAGTMIVDPCTTPNCTRLP